MMATSHPDCTIWMRVGHRYAVKSTHPLASTAIPTATSKRLYIGVVQYYGGRIYADLSVIQRSAMLAFIWVLLSVGQIVAYNVNLGTTDLSTVGPVIATVELSCPLNEDTRLPDALLKLGKATPDPNYACPLSADVEYSNLTMRWSARRYQTDVVNAEMASLGAGSEFRTPICPADDAIFECPRMPCVLMEVDYQNYIDAIPQTMIGTTSCGAVFGRGGLSSKYTGGRKPRPAMQAGKDTLFYPGDVRKVIGSTGSVRRISELNPLSALYSDEGVHPVYESIPVPVWAPVDGLGPMTGEHDFVVGGISSQPHRNGLFCADVRWSDAFKTVVGCDLLSAKVRSGAALQGSGPFERLRIACENEVSGVDGAMAGLVAYERLGTQTNVTCYACQVCDLTSDLDASWKYRDAPLMLTLIRRSDVKMARDGGLAGNAPVHRAGSEDDESAFACSIGENSTYTVLPAHPHAHPPLSIEDECHLRYLLPPDQLLTCACYRLQEFKSRNRYYRTPLADLAMRAATPEMKRSLSSGGTCTCPDGQQYLVGDNDDNCGSLACNGGQAGQCTEGGAGAFAGFAVDCDEHIFYPGEYVIDGSMSTARREALQQEFQDRSFGLPDLAAILDVPADCCQWVTRPMTDRAITPVMQNITKLAVAGLNDVRLYHGCPQLAPTFGVYSFQLGIATRDGTARLVVQEGCTLLLAIQGGSLLRYTLVDLTPIGPSRSWTLHPVDQGPGALGFLYDELSGVLQRAQQELRPEYRSILRAESCPPVPHHLFEPTGLHKIYINQVADTLNLPLGCEVETIGIVPDYMFPQEAEHLHVFTFRLIQLGQLYPNQTSVYGLAISPYTWLLVNGTDPWFIYYEYNRSLVPIINHNVSMYVEVHPAGEAWIDRGIQILHERDLPVALIGADAVAQACCPWFEWRHRYLCAADHACNTGGLRCTMTAVELIDRIPEIPGFLDKCQQDRSTPPLGFANGVARFADSKRDFTEKTVSPANRKPLGMSIGTPIDRRGEPFVNGATDWHDEESARNATTAGRVRKTFVINPGQTVGDTIIIIVAESPDEKFRTVAKESGGNARLRTWTVYVPGLSVVDPCTSQAVDADVYLASPGLRRVGDNEYTQDEVLGGESIWNITVVVEALCAREYSRPCVDAHVHVGSAHAIEDDDIDRFAANLSLSVSSAFGEPMEPPLTMDESLYQDLHTRAKNKVGSTVDSRIMAAVNAYATESEKELFERYGVHSMRGHADARDGGNGEYCRWQFPEHREPTGDWDVPHPVFTLPCTETCEGGKYIGRVGKAAMQRFGQCGHTEKFDPFKRLAQWEGRFYPLNDRWCMGSRFTVSKTMNDDAFMEHSDVAVYSTLVEDAFKTRTMYLPRIREVEYRFDGGSQKVKYENAMTEFLRPRSFKKNVVHSYTDADNAKVRPSDWLMNGHYLGDTDRSKPNCLVDAVDGDKPCKFNSEIELDFNHYFHWIETPVRDLEDPTKQRFSETADGRQSILDGFTATDDHTYLLAMAYIFDAGSAPAIRSFVRNIASSKPNHPMMHALNTDPYPLPWEDFSHHWTKNPVNVDNWDHTKEYDEKIQTYANPRFACRCDGSGFHRKPDPRNVRNFIDNSNEEHTRPGTKRKTRDPRYPNNPKHDRPNAFWNMAPAFYRQCCKVDGTFHQQRKRTPSTVKKVFDKFATQKDGPMLLSPNRRFSELTSYGLRAEHMTEKIGGISVQTLLGYTEDYAQQDMLRGLFVECTGALGDVYDTMGKCETACRSDPSCVQCEKLALSDEYQTRNANQCQTTPNYAYPASHHSLKIGMYQIGRYLAGNRVNSQTYGSFKFAFVPHLKRVLIGTVCKYTSVGTRQLIWDFYIDFDVVLYIPRGTFHDIGQEKHDAKDDTDVKFLTGLSTWGPRGSLYRFGACGIAPSLLDAETYAVFPYEKYENQVPTYCADDSECNFGLYTDVGADAVYRNFKNDDLLGGQVHQFGVDFEFMETEDIPKLPDDYVDGVRYRWVDHYNGVKRSEAQCGRLGADELVADVTLKSKLDAVTPQGNQQTTAYPQQFAVTSVRMSVCATPTKTMRPLPGLRGGLAPTLPPLLSERHVGLNNPAIPTDYIGRAYYADVPKSPIPDACDCGGARPVYACQEFGADKAFELLGVGCIGQTTVPDTNCVVCGWSWSRVPPGGRNIGLFMGSTRSPVYIMERDPLGDEVAAATDLRTFYLGNKAPELPALRELIADMSGQDDFSSKHVDPERGHPGFTSNNQKVTITRFDGSCLRAPYGRLHRNNLDPAHRFTYYEQYPDPSVNGGLSPAGDEAILTYCERSDAGKFHYCVNDGMSTEERIEWCRHHTDNGHEIISLGHVIRERNRDNKNPTSVCRNDAGHLTCLYIPGDPAQPRFVDIFFIADEVLPNAPITVIVAPFNFSALTNIQFSVRQTRTGTLKSIFDSRNFEDDIEDTTAVNMGATAYKAPVDAMRAIADVSSASGVPEIYAALAAVSEFFDAFSSHPAAREGRGQCPEGSRLGPPHAGGIMPVNYGCYTDKTLTPLILERGVIIDRPDVTVAPGVGDIIHTTADDDSVPEAATCTIFLISQPRFTVVGQLGVSARGCVSRNQHERIPLRFSGSDVSGASVTLTPDYHTLAGELATAVSFLGYDRQLGVLSDKKLNVSYATITLQGVDPGNFVLGFTGIVARVNGVAPSLISCSEPCRVLAQYAELGDGDEIGVGAKATLIDVSDITGRLAHNERRLLDDTDGRRQILFVVWFVLAAFLTVALTINFLVPMAQAKPAEEGVKD